METADHNPRQNNTQALKTQRGTAVAAELGTLTYKSQQGLCTEGSCHFPPLGKRLSMMLF